MGVVLVDSNVVLDLSEPASAWHDWAIRQLEATDEGHRIVANAVVYCEVSIGFDAIEECEALFRHLLLDLIEIPREALFLAGKAFLAYRRRGGMRTAVLPDFFIGAHAAVLGMTLLTRDARRYRTYFPTVSLIAPGAH